jgi:tricorn protease
VTEVLPLSPAALAGITPGAVIRSVDGVAVGRTVNLDSLLAYKTDRRVTLGVGGRDVVVRPTSAATEKRLLYRAWVDANREYVAKASGGRLGYVHMLDMSDASLAQLHVDLDTENHAKEGVVIDVRSNNGGFVNAYALDVLARRGYLFFQNRNGSGKPIPARSQLGQRALEAPTILLTNQHSLSDAEDFTEGYRSLKLGTVVGEPTAGWIVYTSNVPLLDGTVIRLPGTLVTTSSGEKMEMSPRPVDIRVDRPLGESYSGRDRQLDTAVAELLKQLATRGVQKAQR